MYSQKPKLRQRQRNHKKGSLRTIAFDVTGKCNMSCPHCYAETFARAEPAALEVLDNFFGQAYELGVHHYVLQGGEPIVDPERLEYVLKGIYPDETYINVVSNGWSMTREKIRWLKGLKVDKIAFSLDSGLRDEHDKNRAKDSYRRVVEAIDNVIAEGLLTSISTVVTHESLYSEGFNVALDFARRRQIRMDVQIAMPVGKWDANLGILITADDAAYIKRLQSDCGELKNGQRVINRDIFNFGGRDHCPAGTEFMAITVDGNILPCNFCQFTLGNIKNRSLKEMRDDLISSSWFDGSQPDCLLGENRDFFERFVGPYIDEKKPLNAYKIFNLTGELNGTKI